MAGDWSLLPIDLLGAIAIKLETIEDFICFSAVCCSWNCASSSVKHLWKGAPLPWLLLAENTKENPDCIREVFNLNHNKCYKLKLPETFGARCWGSPYGWIAMVTRDFNVQLFNPITHIKLQFPPCQTLPVPPIYFDEIKGGDNYYRWVLRCFLKKLIVIKVSEGDRHDFVIVILYNDYYLAFARHGDRSWTSVLVEGKDDSIWPVDLVTMDDYLFGLYYNGAIVYWKVEEFLGQELATPMEFSPSTPVILADAPEKGLISMFLVESGSDLLMVLRYKDEVLNSDGDDSDYNVVYLSFSRSTNLILQTKAGRKLKTWVMWHYL